MDRSERGSGRMGIKIGSNLRAVQGCSWASQPEGLEGSEGQDLGPWLSLAHTHSCQHTVRGGVRIGPSWGHSPHQAHALSHSVSPRTGEALGSVRGRVPGTPRGRNKGPFMAGLRTRSLCEELGWGVHQGLSQNNHTCVHTRAHPPIQTHSYTWGTLLTVRHTRRWL